MRIALFSDVHADLHALHDALSRIDALRCDLIVCAGDLVDYGLFPEETLELLAARKIPCIRGNHDRWALTGDAMATTELPRAARRWMQSQPTHWSQTIEGLRVAVHHAAPESDMHGLMPEELDTQQVREALDVATADILIVGHTHVPMDIELRGRGRILNPGALLRDPAVPGEVPTPGTFGVLDLPSGEFQVLRAKDGERMPIATRKL